MFHIADLVKYIREQYDDYFCIGVAAYPEGHIDSPDREVDLQYLKDKQDAGADYVVTQLFYDVDIYLQWLDRCKEIGKSLKYTVDFFLMKGVTIPILPGIMPIQNYGGFRRMTTLCKTGVPEFILKDLEPIMVKRAFLFYH